MQIERDLVLSLWDACWHPFVMQHAITSLNTSYPCRRDESQHSKLKKQLSDIDTPTQKSQPYILTSSSTGVTLSNETGRPASDFVFRDACLWCSTRSASNARCSRACFSARCLLICVCMWCVWCCMEKFSAAKGSSLARQHLLKKQPRLLLTVFFLHREMAEGRIGGNKEVMT